MASEPEPPGPAQLPDSGATYDANFPFNPNPSVRPRSRRFGARVGTTVPGNLAGGGNSTTSPITGIGTSTTSKNLNKAFATDLSAALEGKNVIGAAVLGIALYFILA